jgi:hypothetical protein
MSFLKKSALIVGVVSTLLCGNALASGSETISTGPSNDARLYNVGKGVYADKFACSSCPLADKTLNADLAKDMLNGKPKVELSSAEADALAVYLKRRFKI